jgi:P2 family phage contractile tail tube protein
MDIGHKLTHWNLFIDGKGHAGTIRSLELPKTTFKKIEAMGGGQDAPIAIPMEMGLLTANITLGSYDPEVFRLMGWRWKNPAFLIARGAITNNQEVIPMTATFKGIVNEVDAGTWKRGEDTELKFSIDCEFYSLIRGAEELIYIDIKNMVRRFGGIDQLKAIRDALLIS